MGLPLPYVIDLLKDIRNVVSNNKENFLIKMSELLFYRKLYHNLENHPNF
jgi:hypothetical protein